MSTTPVIRGRGRGRGRGRRGWGRGGWRGGRGQAEAPAPATPMEDNPNFTSFGSQDSTAEAPFTSLDETTSTGLAAGRKRPRGGGTANKRGKYSIESGALAKARELSEAPEKALKDSIQHVKFADNGKYYCMLCYSEHPTPPNLKIHFATTEHIRRLALSQTDPSLENPFFCSTCTVMCESNMNMELHLKGKKHLKMSETANKILELQGVSIAEEIFETKILSEGVAKDMGITDTMKRFLDLEGPFIGLQYAVEEVGADPAKPMYHCTLCGVTTTEGNKEVHFKSSNHIQKVLKKDHPERWDDIQKTGSKAKELNDQLLQTAKEIESIAGRNISDITLRKIEVPQSNGQETKAPKAKKKPAPNKGQKSAATPTTPTQVSKYKTTTPQDSVGYGGYTTKDSPQGYYDGRHTSDTYSYDSYNRRPINTKEYLMSALEFMNMNPRMEETLIYDTRDANAIFHLTAKLIRALFMYQTSFTNIPLSHAIADAESFISMLHQETGRPM